jgi:glutamate synthase (NADPH/NADH) small chain
MGKPTGFLEYERKDVPERNPQKRVLDFQEFHLELIEEERRRQGARCMDCGVPFCQSGTGCPVNNLIPEWNDLIYRGRYREALRRLLSTNNFPEFTGLVCPAPCETSCVLSIIEPAVTIKANEYYIAEKGFEEEWIQPEPPGNRTGKKVAVIGSGPSGLAAADQLNRVGHEVSVFERSDRIGGLLMYGIPNMKLEKTKVNRRTEVMAAEGVSFYPGTHIGVDVDVQDILSRHDALLLACGAGEPRDLPVPGRDLKGVHFAMDFLHGTTKSLLDGSTNDSRYISARDRKVIVIGGGDTGNDCIGTSLRQGCRSIVNFEILPKPPSSRSFEDPWPTWPRILRTDYGHTEAAGLFRRDPRIYSIMVKRFEGNNRGELEAAHTVKVRWSRDESGRFKMEEIPGTEETYQTDLVFLAMGFVGPEQNLIQKLDLETDSRSNVKTEVNRYMSSREGVFAAGDMRRGQSLVVWAINEGRKVAREIDRYLTGSTLLP